MTEHNDNEQFTKLDYNVNLLISYFQLPFSNRCDARNSLKGNAGRVARKRKIKMATFSLSERIWKGERERSGLCYQTR